MGEPPVALYIHFPFCLSVCPYCDFVVYGGRAARGPDNKIDALVEALVAEMRLRGRAARLGSVYMGGGTPSLMTPEQVARLLAAANDHFGIADDAEITLEVNPGTSDRGDVAGFVAAGVNRVSIGAQSMDANELRTLGRRHSPSDVADTIRAARAAGVRSLSIDLLYDVPGQTIAAWRDSLDGTLALEPDHVSAYSLTLDQNEPADDHLAPSAGATRWRARARLAQDDDRAAEMYELLDDRLARAGLPWYEISNFARPGHESRHNTTYWQSQSWEAVGPGAHRFDGTTRSWNLARLDAYLVALSDNRQPPAHAVTNSDNDAAAERAILRLRTSAGLSSAESRYPGFRSAVTWGLANQLLERTTEDNEEGVRLTRRGRLLSNEVFSRLLPEAAVAA